MEDFLRVFTIRQKKKKTPKRKGKKVKLEVDLRIGLQTSRLRTLANYHLERDNSKDIALSLLLNRIKHTSLQIRFN